MRNTEDLQRNYVTCNIEVNARPSSPHAEFLKGATIRSRKIFQGLRKIWVFECKNAQFTTVLPFLSFFILWFLAHFVCAKLLDRNIGRAKKIAFKKSVHMAGEIQGKYIRNTVEIQGKYMTDTGKLQRKYRTCETEGQAGPALHMTGPQRTGQAGRQAGRQAGQAGWALHMTVPQRTGFLAVTFARLSSGPAGRLQQPVSILLTLTLSATSLTPTHSDSRCSYFTRTCPVEVRVLPKYVKGKVNFFGESKIILIKELKVEITNR